MKRYLLAALVVAIGAFCPHAAKAQVAQTCWSNGTGSGLYDPPANQLTAPLCNASGQLVISGSFSSTYPYGVTANQTGTSATFVGIASWDGAHVQPVLSDSSGHLIVNCNSGCSGGSTTFPYGTGSNQAGTANSFLGSAGYDGTHVQPMLVDSTGRVIVSCTSGCAATTFPYGVAIGSQTGTSNSFLGAAGFDGTHVEPLLTDATGRVIVSCTNGCFSALPYSSATASQAATSASALATGCIYNTAAPTITNTQYAVCQADVNGNIKVDVTNTPSQTAASGTLTTSACDPTTTSRCATVTAGGSLDVNITGGSAGGTTCNNTTMSAAETSATVPVLIVAGVNAQSIWICTAQVIGAGAGNTAAQVTLEYGTQTTNPCDTSTVAILTQFNIGSLGGGSNVYIGATGNDNSWYQVPAATPGWQLCTVGAGSTIDYKVLVTYAQHS